MKYSRVFIEKKQGFNSESKNLLEEFKNYLEIKRLEEVRVINVYDLVNANEKEEKEIIEKFLYEPEIDNLYKELNISEDEKAFRIEDLKGQYNKREFFSNKLINTLFPDKDIKILQSKVIILKGINDEEFKIIKDYHINPIEVAEIFLDKVTFMEEKEKANDIEIIDGFIDFSEEKMKKFKANYGIGLDLEDLLFAKKYFKDENRNPSITEIKLIDTYWSDHCRHTTFMTEIKDIKFNEGKYKEVFEEALKKYLSSRNYTYEDEDKAISLMDLATINMKELKKEGLLEDKEQTDEVNAASIEIDVDIDGKAEKWLLMFKNETHNHPTEMEPFGGAATCLGGGIRDPLSGRSYVYQAMRITGSADPRKKYDETLKGKLPQRKITKTAMKGYSSYGNEIGASTGYVREIYDEGFLAKRMECGALVAAAPKEWVYRGNPSEGDLVLLVGGRTGRDGLGGAVGSSKEHTEKSLHTSGAEVQKGDPSLERKIIRLFRKENVSKMIKKCNDFGAGGVGVAIGELADGLTIELDNVKLKYPGLDGTEIALSESQERMAVLIDKNDLDKFLKETNKEDLEATVIAKVTEERILKMFWKDKEIVNIKRDFLDTNGIRKNTKVEVENPSNNSYLEEIPSKLNNKSKMDSLKMTLKDINNSSQKGLLENFDTTVGGTTVLMPYGGKYMLSPIEGMVSKIPVLEGETSTCSIMTYGYEPKLAKWSPFHGGYYSVIESIAKVVALGGDYRNIKLTFQEYFERLGENSIKWGKPFSALLGAYLVQKELDIASIGGKDSMSGTFEDIDVPPTLISFGVTTEKLENIVSNEFKYENSNVLLIPLEIDDKGLIDFKQLKNNYRKVKELIHNKKIKAIQSIKEGGIARTICEMAFGNKMGFKFNDIEKAKLFRPLFGSLVIEISKDEDIEKLFQDVDYEILGKTINESKIYIDNDDESIDELINIWESPLKDIFPIKNKNLKEKIEMKNDKKIIFKSNKSIKPKILIPIFTGTHGEYTLANSFKEAGGEVDTFVFKFSNKISVEDSFKEFRRRIEKSQIIAFPHGAVFGGEPETGGKLIKYILNEDYIKEEIQNHLNLRDGLILGIGDGFQGLIKSGLIADSVTLAENESGEFISTTCDIVVENDSSPWFNSMNIGDIYTAPVATKEGRLILTDGNNLSEQIPTTFSNENPTGSLGNIESLTSKDGRILGTISSIDRIHKDLYKNIEIKGTHNIFKSGVKYFD
ncbi:phosphoribosylformylglycinamidine synthase [Senegalia massiliensis]|uniref:Phosphoribosylformylglycinamidine synthase n=1 Tax=Senegalia massiliensis TaxID=1720316 RepID=A0A845R123_9CLOT|nr:phosphoribosylformylglycinamidine synthase [Senegalia massiliensis]NBI07954.1 phosphoribosylformylglycinamidine synthase [Senegalia massiliensis]